MQIPTLPLGVARHRDLLAIMGKRRLRAALQAGVLTQLWRGVVVRADTALDLRTRAAAAVLAVGDHAVLSGATAIALHGYDAAECTDIHLTLPYTRYARSRCGLIVHQRRFEPADVVLLHGLPVFALDLALADFLCERDLRSAFAALDQALYNLDPAAVAAVKSAVRRRLSDRADRRGVAEAIALTELATGRADSPPESWFRLIVAEAGLPVPEPQHEIRTVDGTLLYVLDMAWVELRIALEYDGHTAHEERGALDVERDRRLARRGWIIVRARIEDVKDPTRVLGELSGAFALRGH